jgi:histone deacetylase 11
MLSHASGDDAGGFCVYADISLCIRKAKEEYGCKNPLIVDLDCHQGNGYERDVLQGRFPDISVGILDAYNLEIYPCDRYAKSAITFPIEFRCGCKDDEYLSELKKTMKIAMECEPDFIIYNAGTDILEGDPLGRCDISSDGIVERDEIVFRAAREADVPVLMLLSGGYQKGNSAIIARSILNLRDSLSLF